MVDHITHNYMAQQAYNNQAMVAAAERTAKAAQQAANAAKGANEIALLAACKAETRADKAEARAAKALRQKDTANMISFGILIFTVLGLIFMLLR